MNFLIFYLKKILIAKLLIKLIKYINLWKNKKNKYEGKRFKF